MVKVILDPGSCHNGKLEYAKELIDLAAEVGAFAVKFQLFEEKLNGNIELPRKWWPELVEYAKGKIDIFASCFDEEAIQLLHDTGIKKIKLSYSQAFNLRLIKKAKQLGMEIWASGDLKCYPHYADKVFYCVPEYPPRKPIEFYWINPPLFVGYSSHYLGFKYDLLMFVYRKFEYLEKHFTLDHDDIDCPDHFFALIPKELKELLKCLSA